MSSAEPVPAFYPANTPGRDHEVDHCIQQNLQTLETLERAIWQGDHIDGQIASVTQVLTIRDTNSKFENAWNWAESMTIPSHVTNKTTYTRNMAREAYNDARKAARRTVDQIRRVKDILNPGRCAARVKKAERRRQRKILDASSIEEIDSATTNFELARAKNTALPPNTFSILDIQIRLTLWHLEAQNPHQKHSLAKTPSLNPFSGRIIIEKTPKARNQALSDHNHQQTALANNRRYAIFVDASIDPHTNSPSGLGIAFQPNSPDWTTRGYQITEPLSPEQAETWAIWQALQLVLETIHNALVAPFESISPYLGSTVIVYSDCASALGRFKQVGGPNEDLIRDIIATATALNFMGLEVELRWVPGHRGVPGNELAHIVANKARVAVL